MYFGNIFRCSADILSFGKNADQKKKWGGTYWSQPFPDIFPSISPRQGVCWPIE